MNKNFSGYFIADESSVSLSDKMLHSIMENKKPRWLACINPHSYVTAESDRPFAVALSNADWLIPDGIGVVIFSALIGERLGQRVTGWDVFYDLSYKMNQAGNMSVFFLGSTESNIEAIKGYMGKEFPNINFIGGFSPPFKESFDKNDTAEMVAQINAVSPDVLWVGLTAPKQERWLNENIDNINVKVAGAIGAVFDFCSGNVKRAPIWMQRCGIEWLHRSLSSPSRLGKRNAISNPIFIYLMIKKWLSKVRREI
mgnify:CR=1 FL=1